MFFLIEDKEDKKDKKDKYGWNLFVNLQKFLKWIRD